MARAQPVGKPPAEQSSFDVALQLAQTDGLAAAVRRYCQDNEDIEQCRQVLALVDAAIAPVRIETSMLTAVTGDLEALAATLTGGARKSLAALALWLAEVIDKRGGEAGPTTTARLAQELRATLQALTVERDHDGDSLAALIAAMSTPVGHTPDAEPAKPRAPRRRNGQAAGQAADAAPATHRRRRAGN